MKTFLSLPLFWSCRSWIKKQSRFKLLDTNIALCIILTQRAKKELQISILVFVSDSVFLNQPRSNRYASSSFGCIENLQCVGTEQRENELD